MSLVFDAMHGYGGSFPCSSKTPACELLRALQPDVNLIRRLSTNYRSSVFIGSRDEDKAIEIGGEEFSQIPHFELPPEHSISTTPTYSTVSTTKIPVQLDFLPQILTVDYL